MENICPIGAAAMRVSKTKTATLIWTNLCAEEKKNNTALFSVSVAERKNQLIKHKAPVVVRALYSASIQFLPTWQAV